MVVDRTELAKPGADDTAAYRRVEQDLRARIKAGQWPAGSLLPNRRELARQYGVAVNTIQRAITALLNDRTVSSHGRRGTVVSSAPLLSGVATPSPNVNGNGGSASETPPPRRAIANTTLGIIASLDRDIKAEPSEYSAWIVTVVRALERAFTRGGGRARFFNVMQPYGDTYPSAAAAVRSALDNGVDALAMVNVYEYANWLEALNAANASVRIPVVYVSSTENATLFAHIFYRQRHSGYHAAQHLIASGYRRILFLTPYSADWLAQRLDGAREAVQQAGLPADSLLAHPRNAAIGAPEFWNLPAAQRLEATRGLTAQGLKLLDAGSSPAGSIGIIAPNDDAACDVWQTLKDMGLVAGRDVGVIGFDNALRAGMLGLSSMAPPLEDMGEAAADMMLWALRGESVDQQRCLYAHLIQRASTSRTPSGVPS
jgi:DNA-binding LacI/PurR family transcriptional regulator